jgi:hypothetical protein
MARASSADIVAFEQIDSRPRNKFSEFAQG